MPFKHQEQKNKKQKILSFVTMARIWYYHEHKRVYSNSFNASQTPRENKNKRDCQVIPSLKQYNNIWIEKQ